MRYLYHLWLLIGRFLYVCFGFFVARIVLNNSIRSRVVFVDKSSGKILLTKSWFGWQKWEFPGGGVGSNEDLYVAAIREIHEEIGYRLTQSDLEYIGDVECRNYSAKFLNHIFIARVDIFKPKISWPEMVDSKWCSLTDIDGRSDRQTIDFVVSYLKSYQ